MKRYWIVPILASFAAVGCNAGDGASAAASSSASPAPAAAESPATTVGTPLVYPETGHPITATTTDEATLAFEANLEILVNQHRILLGLPPLEILPEAKDLARGHAVHMALHAPGFFDHCNPEGDLPCNRAEKAGLEGLSIGENLAAGHATADQVLAAWLLSDAHRAVLEDPRWTAMGAGRAWDPTSIYGSYWSLTLVEKSGE